MLALCAVFAVRAETHAGVVIVVIDGDTVLFKPDAYAGTRAFIKVRLAGIDAPEAGQAHGETAAAALRTRVLRQRATLDIVAVDRYDRRIGRLTLGGEDVSAWLVREGHAWADRRAGPVLEGFEAEARAARRGLWQARDPLPPWQWRRLHAR